MEPGVTSLCRWEPKDQIAEVGNQDFSSDYVTPAPQFLVEPLHQHCGAEPYVALGAHGPGLGGAGGEERDREEACPREQALLCGREVRAPSWEAAGLAVLAPGALGWCQV